MSFIVALEANEHVYVAFLRTEQPADQRHPRVHSRPYSELLSDICHSGHREALQT